MENDVSMIKKEFSHRMFKKKPIFATCESKRND